MRPISRTSRKPRVVMKPTGAPRRSTMALVTMVVPWASETQGPVLGARAAIPSSTPSAGLAGVVGTLHDSIRPAGSHATRSVNVPPTSTPILTPSAITDRMVKRDGGGERPISHPWEHVYGDRGGALP